MRVYIGNPLLNLTRLICALLMHISLLPTIASAKQMLSFGKKNVASFSGQAFELPMMFAWAKLFGVITAYFTNMFLLVTNKTPLSCITGFVSIQIISTVSKLMAATVSEEDSVGSMKLLVSKEKMRMTDIQIWSRYISGRDSEEVSGEMHQPFGCLSKAMLVLYLVAYRLCSIFYHVIFFYFAPFLISVILIFMKKIDKIRDDNEERGFPWDDLFPK